MLLPMSFVLILHDELSVQVDVCVRTFLKFLAKNLFVCCAHNNDNNNDNNNNHNINNKEFSEFNSAPIMQPGLHKFYWILLYIAIVTKMQEIQSTQRTNESTLRVNVASSGHVERSPGRGRTKWKNENGTYL